MNTKSPRFAKDIIVGLLPAYGHRSQFHIGITYLSSQLENIISSTLYYAYLKIIIWPEALN